MFWSSRTSEALFLAFPLALSFLNLPNLPQRMSPLLRRPAADVAIRYVRDSYISDGRRILVERFEPTGSGRYPTVIMIHGAAGLYKHEGDALPPTENFGEQQLAKDGYIALLVHYFDSTGDLSVLDGDSMLQKAPIWLATLTGAVDYAEKQPRVDRHRIALLGESLGGFLAVALAARDRRIAAVSEFSGGAPELPVASLRQLPPMLIQHGELDTVVPVQEAYRLERILREANVPCQTLIYPGEGHYLDSATRERILERTLEFFHTYLVGVGDRGL